MIDRKVRSGGSIICDVFLEEGVTAIFGMPGGASLPFYDALYHYPQIKHYLMRNEQGAGYAADGYARVLNSVGVATSTSGPGATNLVTPIASAMMDSIPVVYLTGQVATPFIGTDAFQETDITGVTIPITKQNYLVKSVHELPRIMKEAFYLARSGRPGPVLVDVPKDVFLDETDEPVPESVELRGYKPAGAGHRRMIRKAAELIGKSERPVIMAGHGVAISGAFEELRELAEKAEIPVITTLHGVGDFPETHPLSFGMIGMHGMYYANMAVSECDLIIGLGLRFDDRVTGRVSDFAPKAKIIHVDIDPAEIEKVVPTAVPIVGDVKATLRILNPLVSANTHTAWLEELNRLRTNHPSHEPPPNEEFLPQHMVRYIYEADGGRSDSRGRRRAEPDVGVADVLLREAIHLLLGRRAGRNGLRAPGGDGRAGGPPGPDGLVRDRRRRLADQHSRARGDGRIQHSGQGRRNEQCSPRHDPAVAEPLLQRAADGRGAD